MQGMTTYRKARPMINRRRHTAPDHKGAAAVAGLTRRLGILRLQEEIDQARREGRHGEAEALAAAHYREGASLPPLRPGAVTYAEAAPHIAARKAARDQAAATAGIPLGERIGRANPHAKPIG